MKATPEASAVAASAAPVVTVVTPARNSEETIGRTLESLLEQTFRDWEAIVVDDGSADATAERAEAIAACDARIRVLRSPPGGVSVARNAGIDAARGDWLLFLDADDWLLPEALERLLAQAKADPEAGVVYGGWIRFNRDGDVVGAVRPGSSGDLFDELARHCLFAPHCCLVARDAVAAAGGFEPELSTAADWDLWQRIARTGTRFAAVDADVAMYRVAPGSMSTDPHRALEEELWVLERTHGVDPRVRAPHPAHAGGRPRGELAEARLDRLLRASGFALAQGGDPAELLDALDDDDFAALTPAAVARRFQEVLPVGLALPPAGVAAAWPALEERLERFLALLEERASAPLLARRSRRALEKLLVYQLGLPEVRLGRTARVAVDVEKPIADVRVSAEVLVCDAIWSRGSLGPLELPVCDGVVPAQVLRDAIADRHAWQLLAELFAETVYPSLERLEHAGRVTLLREGTPIAEVGEGDDLHQAVGWTVFLQELWGRPASTPERFYAAEGADEGARTLEAAETVTLELSGELPNLQALAADATVRVTLGGSLVAALRVRGGRLIGAQELRSRVLLGCGFELCRVAVREGVLGAPLAGPPLRERLAHAAAAQDAAAAGGGGAVLARRPGRPVGSSVSRAAALPAGAWPELRSAADVAGEVALAPRTGAAVSSVVYAPDVAEGVASDVPAVDPGDAYEEAQDAQLLALLPAEPVDRALLVGRDGGAFAAKLAGRVGELVVGESASGRFELIVCREPPYHLRVEELAEGLRRLAESLRPGGRLLTLADRLVLDGPARPALDLDRPFGGALLAETLAQVESLQPVHEVAAPLHVVRAYEKARRFRRGQPAQAERLWEIPPLPDGAAERVVWADGETAASGPVWSRHLPVLAYRRIDDPAALEEQLGRLRAAGYRSIPLDEWRAAASARRPVPGRPVLLTFDGGSRDFLTVAWPLLRRYGLTAAVFLIAGEIGASEELLDWSDARRLAAEGVEFGSQSFSSLPLTGLTPVEIAREASRSRALIQQHVGHPVTAFAYPDGESDPAVSQLIGACGYTYAFTLRDAVCSQTDPLLHLPRLAITEEIAVDGFVDLLREGGRA